jgi:hypothetical protein
VEAALMARPCNTPMRGIYGVESVCARPEGHTGKHDSIWNYEDWGGAALRDLAAQAEAAERLDERLAEWEELATEAARKITDPGATPARDWENGRAAAFRIARAELRALARLDGAR